MVTKKLGTFLRAYSIGLIAVVLGCTSKWILGLPALGMLFIGSGILALGTAFRKFEHVVELSQQQEWRVNQADKMRYKVLQEVHHN